DGNARLPAGVKLVVSIHAARPASGWYCAAMRAVKSMTFESGPERATNRKGASVSAGGGSHAIHAPFERTGTGRPSTVRVAGPLVAPRTAPNRNAESCDSMMSVAGGGTGGVCRGSRAGAGGVGVAGGGGGAGPGRG